jgi:hypothetical protein
MQKALEARKMTIDGSMVFTVKDLQNPGRVNSLIELVKRTDTCAA